jgi:hypothetical protein
VASHARTLRHTPPPSRCRPTQTSGCGQRTGRLVAVRVGTGRRCVGRPTSPRLHHAAANDSVLRRVWRDAPPPVKAFTWAVTMVIVALVVALAHGLGLSLPADVVSDLLRQTERSRVITTTGRPVVRADVGEPRLALRPRRCLGTYWAKTAAHTRPRPQIAAHSWTRRRPPTGAS